MGKIRLLVSGGLGFLGSDFINHIFYKDIYKIINLDNISNCNDETSVDEYIRNSDDYFFIKGNFGDKKLVKKILETYKITHVLNLAATQFQNQTIDDTEFYVKNNVLNLTKFMETCLEYGKIEMFIHMSTFFQNNTHKPSTNNNCLNNYLITKDAGANIVRLYRDVNKMPIIICVSNAIFGIKQCVPAPVSSFLTILKSGNKIPVHINDTKKANMIYITNVSIAFEILFQKGAVGEIYNIVSDVDGCYSRLQLARELVHDFTGTEDYTKWINYINDKTCERYNCKTDNFKLKELGWSISVSTLDGLKIVSDHYKNSC